MKRNETSRERMMTGQTNRVRFSDEKTSETYLAKGVWEPYDVAPGNGDLWVFWLECRANEKGVEEYGCHRIRNSDCEGVIYVYRSSVRWSLAFISLLETVNNSHSSNENTQVFPSLQTTSSNFTTRICTVFATCVRQRRPRRQACTWKLQDEEWIGNETEGAYIETVWAWGSSGDGWPVPLETPLSELRIGPPITPWRLLCHLSVQKPPRWDGPGFCVFRPMLCGRQTRRTTQ